LKTFWKHRDTESTEREARGKARGKARGRGGRREKQEEGEEGEKTRSGQSEKGDMLAMLDAGLHF